MVIESLFVQNEQVQVRDFLIFVRIATPLKPLEDGSAPP
jgi:hypothetical protein